MTFHADLTHFGWIGVQLFFVLSGFLITGILWKEKFKPEPLSHKFKKFWFRRSLRIFPLYIVYLLVLGVVYFITHAPQNFEVHFPYLFTYTFNFTRSLPGWQGDPAYTHLWSLSIEEQFYLVFPLILFFCPPRFIKYFMVTMVLLTPVTRLLLGNYYTSKGLDASVVADSIYWNTLSHLDAFFMGGLIPVLALDKKIRKPARILAGSFVLVFVAGLLNYLNSSSGAFYFNDLGFGGLDPELATNTTRERWLATGRARVGYAVNTWMFYVTGGYAAAGQKYTVTSPQIFAGSFSETHTVSGWVVGAGFEWMFLGNWSAKFEYLYADFGRVPYFATIDPIPPSAIFFANRQGGVSMNDHIVRVGLNYKFY